MKLAPNVKLLPKDKGEDAVIFAGDDAYSHAEHYMQGGEARKRGDKIPPVYLGRRDLGNLENLRIVDDGRLRAMVRRAESWMTDRRYRLKPCWRLLVLRKLVFVTRTANYWRTGHRSLPG